jgi:hypothetical protein
MYIMKSSIFAFIPLPMKIIADCHNSVNETLGNIFIPASSKVNLSCDLKIDFVGPPLPFEMDKLR